MIVDLAEWTLTHHGRDTADAGGSLAPAYIARPPWQSVRRPEPEAVHRQALERLNRPNEIYPVGRPLHLRPARERRDLLYGWTVVVLGAGVFWTTMLWTLLFRFF